MTDATDLESLAVLYSADGEEWRKRDVRAEFQFDQMILTGAADDRPATAINAASITSVTLSVSTSLEKRGRVRRSYFCTIEIGSSHLLEVAAYRPMRSTLGWLRDEPTESIQRQIEAYRVLVRQLHTWLARHKSRATFEAKQAVLDNPEIAKAIFFIVGGGPLLLLVGLLFFDGLGYTERSLGLPRGVAVAVWAIAFGLSSVVPLFGAIRLSEWLTYSQSKRRLYSPDGLPDGLLPPSPTSPAAGSQRP